MIHALINKKDARFANSDSSDDASFYIGSVDFSTLLTTDDTDKIDKLCHELLLKRIKSENNIGPYSKISKNDTSITCSICLELLKEGLYKRVLSCSHVFHKKCIDKWIKNNNYDCSCPLCRKNI